MYRWMDLINVLINRLVLIDRWIDECIEYRLIFRLIDKCKNRKNIYLDKYKCKL